MSFGGGFGGFGSNNNTQSSGFGGFGANNNNNNSNTGGKSIFFFYSGDPSARDFRRCAAVRRAPGIDRPCLIRRDDRLWFQREREHGHQYIWLSQQQQRDGQHHVR
jgi:hypothetical protein